MEKELVCNVEIVARSRTLFQISFDCVYLLVTFIPGTLPRPKTRKTFNKFASVFHRSVLLLILNFVIRCQSNCRPGGESRVHPLTTLTML